MINVAIVGNGPSLLGKSLGAKIDSCDEVVRFNDCNIEGYEKDTGTKTTILFCALRPFPLLSKVDHVAFAWIGEHKQKCFQPQIEKMEEYKGKKKTIVHQDVIKYAYELLQINGCNVKYPKDPKPTTGFCAILHFFTRVPNTKIFYCGFDSFTKGYRYQDLREKLPAVVSKHTIGKEKIVLEKMCDHNLIFRMEDKADVLSVSEKQ